MSEQQGKLAAEKVGRAAAPPAVQAEPPKKINFKEAFEKARQNPAYWEERAALSQQAEPEVHTRDIGKSSLQLMQEDAALVEAVRLLKRARNLWVEDNSITAQEIDLFLGRVGSNTSQV